MIGQPPPHRWLNLALGLAAGVVAILVVLVATGVLFLPPSGTTEVRIVGVEWTIEQGTTASGFGWFGPNTINQTDTAGLPFSVSPGNSFVLVLGLSNLDSVNHTIHSVTATSPFVVTSTTPATPRVVLAGEDDWFLRVFLTAPSVSTTTSFTVDLTVDALGS
ncbi:MAG: hypothetical protein ABSB90_08140 [Thermoplasmata archaeon]|jgi:hypothetical protein